MDREKSVQQAATMQKELLEAWQQANRYWADRMQSEMALWADLASKLVSTRSVPEALEAYAKCVSQLHRRWRLQARGSRSLEDIGRSACGPGHRRRGPGRCRRAQAWRCPKASSSQAAVCVIGCARVATPNPRHDVFGLIRLDKERIER